jgi:dTDP-4-amino-4,6-dideoxygalactose transaminase
MRPSQLGVWPPLPPGVYLRHPAPVLPFPLQEPGCRLFRKARHALFEGVRALGLEPGDEVLMPAYHHGSEVEALIRAGVGCRFYDPTSALEPDADELDALLGPRVRALYLIHYLGFPQDAPGWLAWCRQRGLMLIEDAAQAWLGSIAGRPLGSFGDLAIFCLYKTVGVPDGAALLSVRPAAPSSDGHPLGTYKLARRHGAWLISRSGLLATVGVHLEGGWLPPQQELALGDTTAPPFSATGPLLRRLLKPDPRTSRQQNYRLLLEELADLTPTAFARLPAGAAPFAFPIQSDDKAGLLQRLQRHGISPLNLWAFPHPALPAERFPQAAELRSRLVGLPVHQELRSRDLERIVRAARGGR